MKLRYDFGKSLNLSEFKNRFHLHLGEEVSYTIFLHDFRVDINPSINNEFVYVNVYSIVRDVEEDITFAQIICPQHDKRLETLDIIKKMFPDNGSYYGEFDLINKDEVVKDVCDLISVLHRISNLKAFL